MIKKGDKIIITVGKDKGKTGQVQSILKKNNRVIISKLNLVKKHARPRREGESGQIIDKARAIAISNVSLYCPACQKGVRAGIKLEGDNKSRVCRSCHGSI